MKHFVLQLSGRLALLIFCLAFLPVFASDIKPFQERWIKLGDRTINYTVDHSEIIIDGINETLNAVKVKVKTGAMNLHTCAVFFKNGQTQDLTILNSIPAGGESKIIEMTGNTQPVMKLVFTYDTKNRAIQKADVEIWGRQP